MQASDKVISRDPGEWGGVLENLRAGGEDDDGVGLENALNELAAETSPPASIAPTVLIVADAARNHCVLSDGIASLGGRSITLRYPLDAIIGLQDDSLAIGVVLLPAGEPGFGSSTFLAFMRDTFPQVRRISYAKDASEHADDPDPRLIDARLTCPASLRELAEALELASEIGYRATRRPGGSGGDQRSDRQLCGAWRGADRAAFAELDRRFRHRIRQVVIAMRFSDEDADEIVQETLLGLLLGGRRYRHDCAPARFIGDLTATSILARARGDRRRGRRELAFGCTEIMARQGQQQRGQPDEGLRTAELAIQADAAIANLPRMCRRVFWLRVVEGLSARKAGAMLGITPATVETRLVHARKLISCDMHPYLP